VLVFGIRLPAGSKFYASPVTPKSFLYDFYPIRDALEIQYWVEVVHLGGWPTKPSTAIFGMAHKENSLYPQIIM
jgi:hypothetical protein